jgi:uncharacterized protein (DUF2147 family)
MVMIAKTAAVAALAVFAAALSGAPAYAADSAEGVWQTPDDNAVVKIEACGAALCGRIVTSDQLKAHPDQTDARNRNTALRSRPLKGLMLFYGVKGGPTEWTGGSVYDPEDGKTYKGSIKLTGADTLQLTGCVFRPFCKSERWTRIQ